MPSSHAPNILVVDDNRANRKLTCELLKHLDSNADSAESGHEAIKMHDQSSFDLILMDIQMPGFNGFEATAAIRTKEQGKRTPIVALTAETIDDKKVQLLLGGMDDFLSKPVSENDLKTILERWVRSPLSSSAKDLVKPEPNSAQAKPEPAPQPSSAQAVDIKAVFNRSESLRLSKQLPDLAVDMLTFLIESINSTRQIIRQALENGDLETLLEETHKFHGGCCYCGVPALKHAVKELETQLNKPKADNIAELTHTVVDEMSKLQAWANEHDIEALFMDT